MEEVRDRLDLMAGSLRGEINLPSAFLHEFCILQLRKIAETIAVSCLLAHSNTLALSKETLKEWKMPNVLQELSRLHPDFFPRPVRREGLPDGNLYLHDVKEDCLTKEELKKIIVESGDKLHRGCLKNALENDSHYETDFERIKKLNNKIVLLLNEHTISFSDKKSLYYCALKDASVEGKVRVALASSP